jgi:hypothetical protein
MEHVGMGRHGADHDCVAVVAHAPQRLDPAEVDQDGGDVEPHPEHRKQALATGEELRVLAALGERPQGLLDGGRGDVLELCGNHSAAPLLRSATAFSSKCGMASPSVGSLPPPWIAFQIRSGVHGMRTSCTPHGLNASTTAFTTAGVEAIVPASPTPFVPRVFVVDGVTLWSMSKLIVSAAVGTR